MLLRFMVFVFAINYLFALEACKKEEETALKADFSVEFTDDNHVVFKNLSEGDYTTLIWDFGNGDSDTTTDKSKQYEKYYPVAGDYQASLKILSNAGTSMIAKKSIEITSSDIEVSFSMEVNPQDPNEVFLTNTTNGEYASSEWIYRYKKIEDKENLTAYFPYQGTFQIELAVFINLVEYTSQKSITITQDDPNYVDRLSMVWSDEFDGTQVDAGTWTFETGATGWGNNELQNYTDGDNAEVTDGKLIITAKKINDLTQLGSYTSSRMVSRGKQEFQYGRMEIRAKLPAGKGMWPAIWMLGSNFGSVGWPACGEIDIMEYVGYQPNIVHSTIHTPSGYGVNGSSSSMTVTTCEEEFHNYGLIWTEKEMIFYVDTPDNINHTYAPPVKNEQNWPFDQQAFFILNIAVGGDWGGAQGIDNSIFPQSMEIDYVRVYQEMNE